jgi:hypothetical protein
MGHRMNPIFYWGPILLVFGAVTAWLVYLLCTTRSWLVRIWIGVILACFAFGAASYFGFRP